MTWKQFKEKVESHAQFREDAELSCINWREIYGDPDVVLWVDVKDHEYMTIE